MRTDRAQLSCQADSPFWNEHFALDERPAHSDKLRFDWESLFLEGVAMLRLIAALYIFFGLYIPLNAQKPRTAEKMPVVQTPSSEVSARLPVKRVVLYKNGVGYFEHSARIHGDQELGIDFTTGQLNDVLKSLTVVDLGDGHISGVRYNSIAPLGERLKALRLPFGEQVSRTDFLTAMRGARVEVRSKGETAIGRLLS